VSERGDPVCELDLVAMRGCFDGVIPPIIATCSPAGRPNITHLSQLYVVDPQHIALSNQFVSKTVANLQSNPYASVLVTDSQTYDTYRLDLRFERAETEGPIFDQLRAAIDAIGALVHMESVFRLRGADIYRVERCELVSGERAGSS
jgi:adenylate cyclase